MRKGLRLGATDRIAGLVALAVMLLLALPVAAETRVALVVANSNYGSAPLVNPRHDLELVVPALQSLGFEVTPVLDADLQTFDDALASFAERARDADVALFYFAGHGFAVNDGLDVRNYLMSTSADVSSTSDRVIRAGGIALDEIIDQLGVARTALIFVDACRNDPRVQRGSSSRGLAAIDRGNAGSIFVGLSTRVGDTAADGEPGQGSPFARAFVANIGQPNLRVDDAFTRVRMAVEQETRSAQRPDVGLYELDEPVILQASAEPAGGTTPADEARTLWDSVKNSDSVAMLKTYAETFPDTIYARFALARIAELEAPRSRLPGDVDVVATDPIGDPTASPDVAAIGEARSQLVGIETDGEPERGDGAISRTLWAAKADAGGTAELFGKTEFPGLGLALEIAIRRVSPNESLGAEASHVVEATFTTSRAFQGGSVLLEGVSVRGPDGDAATPLAGTTVLVIGRRHTFAIGQTDADRAETAALLAGGTGLVLHLQNEFQNRARITLEFDGQAQTALSELFAPLPVQSANLDPEPVVVTGSSAELCDSLAATSPNFVDFFDIVPDRAIPACEAAVRENPGVARFQFQLGRAYHVAEQYRLALAAFEQASEGGEAEAMTIAGQFHADGIATAQDCETARNWLVRAVRAGDAGRALRGLGELHMNCPEARDEQRAVEFYLLSLLYGNDETLRDIGNPAKFPVPWGPRRLQQFLAEQGFYRGTIDGDVGPGTVKAAEAAHLSKYGAGTLSPDDEQVFSQLLAEAP